MKCPLISSIFSGENPGWQSIAIRRCSPMIHQVLLEDVKTRLLCFRVVLDLNKILPAFVLQRNSEKINLIKMNAAANLKTSFFSR